MTGMSSRRKFHEIPVNLPLDSTLKILLLTQCAAQTKILPLVPAAIDKFANQRTVGHACCSRSAATALIFKANTMTQNSSTSILYVEDNEDNAYMLSRRLRRRGFNVEIATDGEAGVNMAISLKPDIILMDLNLPVIDGWEATKLLRLEAVTATTPIICLLYTSPSPRD